VKKWNEEKEKKKKEKKSFKHPFTNTSWSKKLQTTVTVFVVDSAVFPLRACRSPRRSANGSAAKCFIFLFFNLFFPGVKYRRIYDHRSYDRGVVVLFF